MLEDDFGFELIKISFGTEFGDKNQFGYVLHGGSDSRWLQR